MPGTAKLTVAWSNSKKTPNFAPTGPPWPAEWASPLSNAKPDGKNSKTCNVSRTSNSSPHHYQPHHQDKHLPPHQHPHHQQFPQHHIHNRISPLPPQQRHRLHNIQRLLLLCCCRRLLSERLVRTVIRRNLHSRQLAVISFDPFHPPSLRRAARQIH